MDIFSINNIVLLLLVLVIIILKAFIKSNKTDHVYHYQPIKYLLTKTELAFYQRLVNFLPSNLEVMCKVRLEDIINAVNNGRRFNPARNKIRSNHIDFVVIEKTTTEIKSAIELNDLSHKYSNRKQRDKFIAEIFEQCNLRLNFVEVKDNYTDEEIQSLLM